MKALRIRLDSGGMSEVLNSGEVRAQIDALANSVASNVDTGSVSEARIVVDSYTTDRAAASVTIAHPAGLRLQAKYGSLTKAAASAGLEVRS